MLVSSQTGFNHHLRYVVLSFPFLFIWIAKLAKPGVTSRLGRSAPALALVSVVTSSLWIYPHSLSYFNELAGGPRNGHAHLGGVDIDTNIDSGQDLLYLKRWIDDHPSTGLMWIAFNGLYDPSLACIDYRKLPSVSPANSEGSPPAPAPDGPLPPGWYALSINKIRSPTHQYDHFMALQPTAMAGYSIYIYHVPN